MSIFKRTFLFLLLSTASILIEGMKPLEDQKEPDLYAVIINGTSLELEKLLRSGVDVHQLYILERKVTPAERSLLWFPVETILLKSIQEFDKASDKNACLKNLHQSSLFENICMCLPNENLQLEEMEAKNFIHTLDASCGFSDKVKITQLLLIYGSEIEHQNIFGCMPLYKTVENNSYDNVACILQWPFKLAQAQEKNSLLAQLYVLSSSVEQEEVWFFLLVLKKNKIKLCKPILFLIFQHIIEDFDRRKNGELVKKIWSSKDPNKTAKKVIKKMILHLSNNRKTAFDLSCQLPELATEKEIKEREKIKKLFQNYLEK